MNAEILNIPNARDFFELCQLDSPFMFLRGNGGKYTLSFDVKSTSKMSKQDTLTVMTYGQELRDSKAITKDVIIPQDGQVHHFDLEFDNGTWNHRIAFGPKNKCSLVFVNTIKVKQNLKKGDHVYRAVFYNMFNRAQMLPENADNLPTTTYTHDNNLVPMSLFDFEKANKDGGYLAYRMLYRYMYDGHFGTYVVYSMYSEPYYIPGQNKPNNDDKYYYLGYVGKEYPMTENVWPASVTFPSTYLGAIKIPVEMSKELKEKGGKVVGVRFCSSAKRQDSQWFEVTPWEQHLPFAFVAETLAEKGKSDDSASQFIQMKTGAIGEGWNDFYFDTPYALSDKDFYVGFCVYDASKKGGAFYLSDNVMDAGPNSRLSAFTSNPGDYVHAGFASDNFTDQALLIQAIVQVEKDVNKVDIVGFIGDSYYYDNKPAVFNVDFKNSGNLRVDSVKVMAGVLGHEQPIIVKFETPLQSGDIVTRQLTLDKLPAVYGPVKMIVKVVAINGQEIENKDAMSFDTEIVNSRNTFDRNNLVELFTDERCINCPRGEKEFFEDFVKLPSEYQSNTIFVAHHEGLGGDIFTMKYTTYCMPFFGVSSVSNQLSINGGAPKMMINRMTNPFLTTPENGIVADMPPTPKILPAFEYATNKAPSYGAVSVAANREQDNSLNIVAKGKLSEAIDKSRPVYLTIMMTQDSLPAVEQKGFYQGFFHNHVLRFVDENGFMGQQIKVDNDNNFEVSYKIKPELVAFKDLDAFKTAKIKDNQFIMLNQNGTSIDSLRTLSHINVIAFIHYAQALMGKYDLTIENPEAFKNEIINASQTKINMSPTSIEDIHSASEDFHFVGSKLVYTVDCKQVRIFSINGVSMSANDQFESGVYVVVAVLSNGQKVVKKLICQ